MKKDFSNSFEIKILRNDVDDDEDKNSCKCSNEECLIIIIKSQLS